MGLRLQKRATFQFQYGTIKRESGVYKLQAAYQFQFQYGTIKRVKAKEKRREYEVSIPVWYD